MLDATVDFIRNTRRGAALAALAAALAFSCVPAYFMVRHDNERRLFLSSEVSRHLDSRMAHARTLIERANSIPGIVALTLAQTSSPTRFETVIRDILRMSGIVESVNIASTRTTAVVIHRDAKEQRGRAYLPDRPATTPVMDKRPAIGFGDHSLLIREALSEEFDGTKRFWGYVTAEASIADLIQELHLRALASDGFGVHLAVEWQSGAAETVVFNGGDMDAGGPAASAAVPLSGDALLRLSVVPPRASPFPAPLLAGALTGSLLVFLLTYHLLRRPQILAREVAARTREIAAEKAALRTEIEARSKAESYLASSYAQLDSIFEHIPGMIVLKRTSDMRISRINRCGERLLGRSRDLVNGRCNEEIYAPSLADLLTQADTQALSGAGLVELPPQNVEMPSAAPRWIQFRETALRDADGNASHLLLFGEDLTERENAQRRYSSLNRVLAALSEINHLIIYARDRATLLDQARLAMQQKGGFPAVWIRIGTGEASELVVAPELRDDVARILREIDSPERRCWPSRKLHCHTMECCNAELAMDLRRRGLQSLVHLPLESADIAWGEIGILGAADSAFTREEHALLEQLAANLSFALDAMRRDDARRAVERELEVAARVFASNSEGIIITDTMNRIVMVNQAFTTVTGYTSDEVIGKTPSMLNSERHSPEFFAQMWRTIQEVGEWRGEVINRRKNGEEFPEWLTISEVRNAAGEVTNYVGVFADLSGRRRIEARLDFLAHYDPLTSLPNREYFGERIAKSLADRAEGQRVALIHFDLDRFKYINETLGQGGGDQLLVEVSSRLLAEVENRLDVARLGGDQFGVLLTDIDSIAQATQVVLRLREQLGRPYLHFFEQEIHVSTSFGISVYPDDAAEAEALARNADAAMYQAIEEGGNTYRFFREDMHEDAAARAQLESRLHYALDRGELSVHFQPFISSANGRIIGAEALLRWHCEELGGYVSPATFVPMLEEIGLIRSVGEWVLRRACSEARRWEEATHERLLVAINISALQLTDDLPGKVAETLAEFGLAPEQIEIELTESAIMRDADRGIRILNELKAVGLHVSIDDFGTGYSSLSYLKRLPASTLKIDRSFVLDIPGDSEAVSIARAILALGHSLRLDIVAEGVETREQVEFFCHNGCDVLQGYYFSGAISPDEFVRLLVEVPTFQLPAASSRSFQVFNGKRLKA